jgi:hypothetical protein
MCCKKPTTLMSLYDLLVPPSSMRCKKPTTLMSLYDLLVPPSARLASLYADFPSTHSSSVSERHEA